MNIKDTIIDYQYMLKGHARGLSNSPPPKKWLAIDQPKRDVILIPGLYERWHFLKDVGGFLYVNGYRVHVVQSIKTNRQSVGVGSSHLCDYLEKENIKNAVLVAHSKGGLLGLHYLINYSKDNRVNKLIAIASPFSGSKIGKLVRFRGVKELLPESEIIQNLKKSNTSGLNVVSIYPSYDNHIWHEDGSKIEGGKNVLHKVRGHHKILFDTKFHHKLLQEIES